MAKQLRIPDYSLFLQSSTSSAVVGRVSSAGKLLVSHQWLHGRTEPKSPPSSSIPKKRHPLLSTRKKLQLVMNFASRSPDRELQGANLHTTSDSDFTRTVSYSKRMYRSPESVRCFKSPIDRLALTRSTSRRPKILRTIGVIKGIKSALLVKKRPERGERRWTPGRSNHSMKVSKDPRVLFASDASDDDDFPMPWEHMTSKYTPLHCPAL